jgi:hypothetical protein
VTLKKEKEKMYTEKQNGKQEEKDREGRKGKN